MKNKRVIYDTLNQPCGAIKVTLHDHTRLIKRSTLLEHGYRIDEERGTMVKGTARND